MFNFKFLKNNLKFLLLLILWSTFIIFAGKLQKQIKKRSKHTARFPSWGGGEMDATIAKLLLLNQCLNF